jgi:type III restriction enzyme
MTYPDVYCHGQIYRHQAGLEIAPEMALRPNFPRSPYAQLVPDQRWFPAAEELRSAAYEKLLSPLVAKIRAEVADWRNQRYAGATSRTESGPDYRFVYVDQEG